ncbi:MAG: hypothetical protein ACN0LA_12195 [Candidatus Longimicrobiales bacterium M2_2A_002]
MPRQSILITAAIILSAAAAYAAQTGTFRVHADGVNSAVASRLHADLVWSEQRIDGVLGDFPDPVGVRVYPTRDAFDAAVDQARGIAGTACWMVGAADDHTLHLLSPGAWREQACEHDPDDREHVRTLIAHEMVHVLHGQRNPSDDIGLLTGIGWFTEGLATWASGQLERQHAGRAAEAIRTGTAPDRLADAWAGPYRYGVAGSMVAFIDHAWGPGALRSLLPATSQEEILGTLGIDEAGFLERWKDWVRAG